MRSRIVDGSQRGYVIAVWKGSGAPGGHHGEGGLLDLVLLQQSRPPLPADQPQSGQCNPSALERNVANWARVTGSYGW